jgi:hypothetical protein
MINIFGAKKGVKTPISKFIREASSQEKTRVYRKVMESTSASQREVIRKAALATKFSHCA